MLPTALRLGLGASGRAARTVTRLVMWRAQAFGDVLGR